MVELFKVFVLQNIFELASVVAVLFSLDVLLRLIPTRKSISLLSLLARGIARLAFGLQRLSNLLPEKRK